MCQENLRSPKRRREASESVLRWLAKSAATGEHRENSLCFERKRLKAEVIQALGSMMNEGKPSNVSSVCSILFLPNTPNPTVFRHGRF